MQEENGGTFPLYMEAIKFINHRDGLVRAAVRTLTLSVYSIREAGVQDFVVREPASDYFRQLTCYLADQCQVAAVCLHWSFAGCNCAVMAVTSTRLA